jgi:hypothetical protein
MVDSSNRSRFQFVMAPWWNLQRWCPKSSLSGVGKCGGGNPDHISWPGADWALLDEVFDRWSYFSRSELENHHVKFGKYSINGPFSKAMLNYQRVKPMVPSGGLVGNEQHPRYFVVNKRIPGFWPTTTWSRKKYRNVIVWYSNVEFLFPILKEL